jgi:hypothetical protein
MQRPGLRPRERPNNHKCIEKVPFLIQKRQARGRKRDFMGWKGRGGGNDDKSIIIVADITRGINQGCKKLEKYSCTTLIGPPCALGNWGSISWQGPLAIWGAIHAMYQMYLSVT